MSLKPRLFTKDARRASQDLAANLQYAVSKVCRSSPVRLGVLKVDYDRFFKDKIATKSSETVAAALKAIGEHVVVVKEPSNSSTLHEDIHSGLSVVPSW